MSDRGAKITIDVDGNLVYNASEVTVAADTLVNDHFTYVTMDEYGATSLANVTLVLVGMPGNVPE